MIDMFLFCLILVAPLDLLGLLKKNEVDLILLILFLDLILQVVLILMDMVLDWVVSELRFWQIKADLCMKFSNTIILESLWLIYNLLYFL